MRDYDESFKEMKKENFNLKLRIFFLEERLGQGKKTSVEDMANSNLELKVRLVIIHTLSMICFFCHNSISHVSDTTGELQTGLGGKECFTCRSKRSFRY